MKQPYHPTNKQPLATDADFARMQRILDKHAEVSINAGDKATPAGDASDSGRVADGYINAGATPVPRQTLEWEPLLPGKRGYYDTTRRYSCSSITIAGHEYFEASKLAGGGAWYYPLAQRLKSWIEAEACCQADHLMDPPRHK